MVSSSVTAGEQIQLKAAPVKAVEYISPSIAGKLLEDGNQARKLGDCLCDLLISQLFLIGNE